jgi:hypothetical protein
MMKAAYRTFALLVALVCSALLAVSGCGGGEEPQPSRAVAFVDPASPDCDVGTPSALKLVRTGGVITMRTQPLVLACGSSPAFGSFKVVGFDTNHGICVSVDGIDRGKTYGAICRDPRTPWLEFCEDSRGCVLRVEQEPAHTVILGLVSRRVAGIRASTESPGEIGDVAVVQVDGDLLQRLHRKEPFGLFALALPGCVPIDRVRLEMLDADGSRVGLARETGGLPSNCK